MSRIGNLIRPLVSEYPQMEMVSVESKDLDSRISYLNAEIYEGKQDPLIRQLTAKVLQNVPERDWDAEVVAIFDFVRGNVRYTRDIDNIELFQKPVRTLQVGIGDCDDLTILLASMLQSVGYPCLLEVVGVSGDVFEHIYLKVGVPPAGPTKWIALDASRDEPAGWEVPAEQVKVRQTYVVE